MNFWGVVILLCIVAGVVLVVGAPRSPAGAPLFAAVTPGALLGALMGSLFLFGPQVGGIPILTTALVSALLALFMRLVSLVWSDAFYGSPRSPAR